MGSVAARERKERKERLGANCGDSGQMETFSTLFIVPLSSVQFRALPWLPNFLTTELHGNTRIGKTSQMFVHACNSIVVELAQRRSPETTAITDFVFFALFAFFAFFCGQKIPTAALLRPASISARIPAAVPMRELRHAEHTENSSSLRTKLFHPTTEP